MHLKILVLTLYVIFFTLATSINLANAAPPPKAFGELPVAYDGAVSPDGSWIAVILNVNGRYHVVMKKTDELSKKPRTTPFGEGVKPKYVKWVSNDRFVVSFMKSEKYRGTPFTTSYLYSRDINDAAGKLLLVPRIFRQFNDRVVDWLDSDPDHILMAFSDKEFDPYPDIKKINLNTSRYKTVKRGVSGIEHWYADHDGTPLIGTGRTDDGKQRRILLNKATEKWDSSEDYPGLDPDTPIYGVLKKGKELVIGDYRGRDTMGLYIYDLELRRITRDVFHNEDYDASGVVLSKDGETIIGAKYTADIDKTELLGRYGTLLDRMRTKFPNYDIDFVDQTADGNIIMFKMSSPTDPGGLFIYSVGDEEPRRIFQMYSGLSSNDLGEVEAVNYTARDGQKIPAFVTFPPGQETAKNLPFIILPHGGPYARDAKRFDYFAQFFASRGYGVLQMNFRGSEGYGKSFAEAGRNNWIVMQEDVEDGTRWLYDNGYADPSRSCIAGWSYGGYAALMGVSRDPDLYKCAIAMAALTDINNAQRDLKKYRGGKHAAKDFFGKAMQDKEVRKQNSPVHVAHNIKVPVFLAHGDLDENVQFDQFLRMKKALKNASVKTTAIKFEKEDHYLSRQKNREKFFIEIDKFLTKVNGKNEYMK